MYTVYSVVSLSQTLCHHLFKIHLFSKLLQKLLDCRHTANAVKMTQLFSLRKLQWCRVLCKEKLHSVKTYTNTWCNIHDLYDVVNTCTHCHRFSIAGSVVSLSQTLCHHLFKIHLFSKLLQKLLDCRHTANAVKMTQLFSRNRAMWVKVNVENGHTSQSQRSVSPH